MTTAKTSEDSERQPLLDPRFTSRPEAPVAHRATEGDVVIAGDIIVASGGESYDDVPSAKRQLGVWSATFMIFNRLIGTGIFATPSVILRASGSVGFSLIMWTLGAVFAMAGSAVYVELGTALPRSGAEKVYMEYFYRKPKFFITCIVCAYFVINAGSAANSVVFGEYALHALNLPTSHQHIRLSAFTALTCGFLLHSIRLRWGVRLMNTLGIFKLGILSFIIISGMFHILHIPGFDLQKGVDPPRNFERGHFWEGTRSGLSAFVTGLFTIIWSYHGYQNANYALSEIKNPVRTMRIASMLAIGLIACLYLLVNISYFAVVSKADMLSSGRMTGALFFRNLFGPSVDRFFSFVIACSTLGNVLSTLFAYGRVVQELGREGVILFPSFFASNKPFNAPMAGIGCQWFTSSAVMLAAPPGDAYLFLLNVSLYPFGVYNTLIAGGLIWARLVPNRFHSLWSPPFRAPITAVVFYFACSVFLLLAPFAPPEPGFKVYQRLPYWIHAATGLSISLLGATYWFVKFFWVPRRGQYRLDSKVIVGQDGVSRNVLVKIAEGGAL